MLIAQSRIGLKFGKTAAELNNTAINHYCSISNRAGEAQVLLGQDDAHPFTLQRLHASGDVLHHDGGQTF